LRNERSEVIKEILRSEEEIVRRRKELEDEASRRREELSSRIKRLDTQEQFLNEREQKMISWGLGSLDELETVEASEQPGESSRQEISDSGAIANDAMHSAAIEVLDSFDPAFLDSFDPLADPYPKL
jgi:seryl-tRNA synthetase